MASLNPISGVLGRAKAAHLLRRATMSPSLQDIQQFANLTVQDAVQALFQADPIPAFPIDPVSGTDWVFPNVQHPDQMSFNLGEYTCAWWLENMRVSGTNLTERMIWFYHTHIPIILERVEGRPQFAIDYLRLLRFYALGNYKDLMRAICIDNAMLIHLDGHLNVVGVPQENFAREFLELFTVGKGPEIAVENYTNFTEQDVKAVTRVLTGWGIDATFATIDPVTSIPSGKVKSNNNTESSQHDVSAKQFSAAFNNAIINTTGIVGPNATIQGVKDELDDLIDLIFNSPHTAVNLCRRIYREFVYFEITPEIETDIIQPLANVLRSNNYEIKSVLEILFQSEHFYDLDNGVTSDDNVGAIIKSPLEVTIGTLRLFQTAIPDKTTQLVNHYKFYSQILNELSLQGLEFFNPYDVAGYDAYFQAPDFQRQWISSNYLANRYKFSELLINGFMDGSTLLAKLDVVDFVKNNCTNPADPTLLVQELVEWMFPIALDTNRFNYFKDTVLLDTLSVINWQNEWNNYINTSNDTNVRLQLEALFLAMMQSPEYQLY